MTFRTALCDLLGLEYPICPVGHGCHRRTRARGRGVSRRRSRDPRRLPPLIQRDAANDVFVASLKQGDPDYYPMMAGQSVGLVRDLPGAGEVAAAVIREARAVLGALPNRVGQA
jgi:hypothetical protein